MSSFHCNNYSSYAPSCPSPLRSSYPTWPSLKAKAAMPADTRPQPTGVFMSSENQMDRAPAFSVRSVGRADDLAEPNQSTQRPTTYGQRYISRISNPLSNIFRPGSSPSSSLSVRNAKRRDAFLNRVKRDRDDERFEARGEQLMIMEYLSEEKKWKAAMQRDADKLFQRYNEYGAEEEQEETMPGMSLPPKLFFYSSFPQCPLSLPFGSLGYRGSHRCGSVRTGRISLGGSRNRRGSR
jgi:hypothetical protein